MPDVTQPSRAHHENLCRLTRCDFNKASVGERRTRMELKKMILSINLNTNRKGEKNAMIAATV